MPEWLWWVIGGLGIIVGVWLIVSLIITVFTAGRVSKIHKEIFDDDFFKDFKRDDFFKGF